MLARDYPQWHWTGADTLRIGALVWTASMFAMAAATFINPAIEDRLESRKNVPRAG
jgi:hypothetical protein